MTVHRTERFWLKPNEELSTLCHLSKNLYNQANYLVRQEFFRCQRWIGYLELYRLLKNTESYQRLPAQSAQQTLRLLDKSWKSFFGAVREWRKHPQKFLGKPYPPKYKKKNGEHLLVFTNQQCRISGGVVRFPRRVGFCVKTRLPENTRLREVRILPRGIGYVLEIVYEQNVPQPSETHRRLVGIDFGLENLVTMVNNIGEEPIVVKGGPVKSTNQFFNKEKARLQRVYAEQGIKDGRRLRRLRDKRERKIADYFHKTSRTIIGWCLRHQIDTIVIGYNELWKQGVGLGRRNNQNFVFVPFKQLVQQIRYKAEEAGIQVIETGEAYTSVCSFLDGEVVGRHKQYCGRRRHRGLFRSADGIFINADVNSAYNIIWKVFPEAFADGIEGVGLHPARSVIVSHKDV